MRVLSLGAGVQSTTLLLMSEHNVLPRLDAAIFADTQAEPQAVYDHLAWLAAHCAIPVYRVSNGDLIADVLDALDDPDATAGHFGQPPFYVRNDPNLDYATAVSGGRLWRKCTTDYKIVPIQQQIRRLCGLPPMGRVPAAIQVEQWLGISLDEKQRMRSSGLRWLTLRYPLIEQHMTRQHCLAWLAKHGYPEPPKSSCIICPFHSNAYWRDMRDRRPAEWQQAVTFDATLRTGKIPGVRGHAYVHRSMVPLAEAPIDDPHTIAGQLPLWQGLCEGVCFT